MSESQKTNIDPITGRALPKGVWYRGPSQYQARKMVDGKRIRKTFASAALARRWLNEKWAEIDLGQFRDTSTIDRIPIRQLIERYRDECMAHRENDRIGHIPALLDDPVASCRPARRSRIVGSVTARLCRPFSRRRPFFTSKMRSIFSCRA